MNKVFFGVLEVGILIVKIDGLVFVFKFYDYCYVDVWCFLCRDRGIGRVKRVERVL